MSLTYLTEVSLSHFRCFRNITLETDSRPVILTGANGSGKTSILEAISLFSPGRGLRRARVDELAHNRGEVGWKVSCRLRRGEAEGAISSWWQKVSRRQLKIDDKSAKQAELNHMLNILWLSPAMDRLWSEGADGRRRFLDRLTMSLIPDHAKNAITYERAMRERNRLLKDGNRDTKWLNVLESQMADFGSQITKGRLYTIERLKKAFNGMESVFPAAGLKLVSREGTCALVTDSHELVDSMRASRGKDYSVGRTSLGPHRADLLVEYKARGIAAKLCSTGEQKALLISLVLANARAIAEDFEYPPVLLLDEIAAHLDPQRFQMLLTEVKGLNSQTWITGTEAALFDDNTSDVQRFEVITDPEGSLVKSIG